MRGTGFEVVMAIVLVGLVVFAIVSVAADIVAVPFWSMFWGYVIITALGRVVEWILDQFIGD